MSSTVILLVINIKCLIFVNRSMQTIIVLYSIDLDSLIIKLTKRLYYLLFSINNSLRTLYFVYCFDFALEQVWQL